MEISSNFTPFLKVSSLLSEQTDEDYLQLFSDESNLLFGRDENQHLCRLRSYSNLSEKFSQAFNNDDELFSKYGIDDFHAEAQINDEAELRKEEKLPRKSISKKRQFCASKEKPYTHLDNLVYETLKIGYKRIIHSSKSEVFIRNHLNSKFADYVFRLGCNGEHKVSKRSNKTSCKSPENLAVSSKCAEVASCIDS
jgi:hypothetical protein